MGYPALRSIPWTRQPQGVVELHPDFRPASVVALGGQVFNFGDEGNGTIVDTSVTRTVGPFGIGSTTDGTAAPNRNVGKVAKFEGPEGLTLMYVFSSTDTSGIQFVAGTLNTGTNYGETLTVNRKSDLSLGAGWLLADIRADGIVSSTAYSTAAATTYFDGLPHCVVTQWTVASAASAAVARMWVDGVEQTTTSAAPFAHSQAPGLVEFDYLINNRNLRGTAGANSLNGAISLFGRWRSAKYDGEALSAEPARIFAPRPRRLFVPTAAAGASNAPRYFHRTQAGMS